jgi:cysteine dioxygenase
MAAVGGGGRVLHLQPKQSPGKPGGAIATPPPPTCPIHAMLAAVRRAFAAGGDDAQLRTSVSTALQEADLRTCTESPDSPWARYVHYGEANYSRNLVAFEGSFSIILNCWKPGQCTPEHDHHSAGGSVAWVKIIKGALVLDQLAGHSEPRTVATHQNLLAGMVSCASAQELGVHRLANRGEGIAISLHVYSPPMLSCCGNPVVLCQRKTECITEKERLNMHSRDPTARLLFTNFRSMVQTMHNEIEPLEEGAHHSPAHIAKISELLTSMRFNQAEFSRYLNFRDDHYTRNLVGYDMPQGAKRAKFTALILCWDKGQMSPIHDHAGSSCWVKVLQGQLREVKYEYRKEDDPAEKQGQKLAVLSDRTFEPESVAYINDTQGVHAMGNPNSDSVTVSLHVYAPPYVMCKMFDPNNGSVQIGSMAAAIMPSNPFTEEVAASAANASNSSSESDKPSSSSSSSSSAPPAKRARHSGEAEKTGAAASSATDTGGGHAASSPSAGLRDSSPLNLSQLQVALKHAVRPDGTCEGAAGLLGRLVLAEHEWQEFVHFAPFQYTRSLVALDSTFSLMALCWNKGHATPLHSHAPGVSSWAKVLRGKLNLKRYAGSNSNSNGFNNAFGAFQSPRLVSEHSFGEGDILDEQEYNGLHVVGNPSTTETTVSLHLYSPPYVDMAYVDSSGRQVSVPVVHSATSACGLPTCEGCNTFDSAAGGASSGTDVDAAVGVTTDSSSASASASAGESSPSAAGAEEASSRKLELASFGSIYSDFHGFVNFLRTELNPDDVVATTAVLEGFQFHPSEWQEYATPPSPRSGGGGGGGSDSGVTVSLIALGENPGDRLELCAWAPGTEGPAAPTPTHMGPTGAAPGSGMGMGMGMGTSRCWLKVLQGELEETESSISASGSPRAKPLVIRSSRLRQGSVTYYHNDDGEEQMQTQMQTQTQEEEEEQGEGGGSSPRSAMTWKLMLRHPITAEAAAGATEGMMSYALRLCAGPSGPRRC